MKEFKIYLALQYLPNGNLTLEINFVYKAKGTFPHVLLHLKGKKIFPGEDEHTKKFISTDWI